MIFTTANLAGRMHPQAAMRRAALVLLVGCGGSSGSAPCGGGTGFHFEIHTPIVSQGELGVTFASGAVVRFDGLLPSGEVAGGVLELDAPYPAEAVDGLASADFFTRPDPGRQASAAFTVDLDACTEVVLRSQELGLDAGLPGACEAGQPGVRVRFHFEPGTPQGAAWYWHDDVNALAIRTEGGVDSVLVSTSLVDPAGHGERRVEYPAGTSAGPASVAFDANAGGLDQWRSGRVPFVADPARCVDVDVPVAFFTLGTEGPYACQAGIVVALVVPPGASLETGELSVVDADGAVQDLAAYLPPPPWSDVVFVRAPRTGVPASVRFTSGASTVEAEVDLDACGQAVVQLR